MESISARGRYRKRSALPPTPNVSYIGLSTYTYVQSVNTIHPVHEACDRQAVFARIGLGKGYHQRVAVRREVGEGGLPGGWVIGRAEGKR